MPILDADLSGRLATQQDAPQKTGKIPENQCITSWDYLLSARGKEVQGPRKIIELRWTIPWLHCAEQWEHPFRNCLPHCLTKCLRPKRPTLSLKKHFWPSEQNITNEKTAQHCFTKCLRPKKRTLSLKKHFWPVKRQQNFIRNNGTALPYKMTEPKNQHLH